MIDTDKYEGHSTEYSYEIVSVDDDKEMDATYARLNDAPLLLAEVQRLQKENDDLLGQINEYEDVIQPKDHKRIERLEKRIEDLQKGLPRCSCPTVDVCGGDSRGIIVAIGFDDGEEFSGYLDRSEW